MYWRIDDIGASTKLFDQYGKKKFYWHKIPFFYFPLANVWFLKRIKPFKSWGPYRELSASELKEIIDIFHKNLIIPIFAITASWVDANNKLIPFPLQFPEQANVLKDALRENKIVIANHGLTHCVVGKHLPRFASSNRVFHREFWSYLDQSVHDAHIRESQKILETYFEQSVEIFVPPGNVWCKKTYQALQKTSIKKVIANRYMIDSDEKMDQIEFIDDRQNCVVIHDRDLVLYGIQWLKKKIRSIQA